ncbi:MAG: LutC/YkgG family protein [Pyrinomonadaceae bacterium]
MQDTQQAQRAIISAIRENLKTSERRDLHRDTHHHQPESACKPVVDEDFLVVPDTAESKVALFSKRLEAVGGHAHLTTNDTDGAVIVEKILDKYGARRIALSDAVDVQRLVQQQQQPQQDKFDSRFSVMNSADRPLTKHDLLDCDAGITSAQWGIAETGSLVLESDYEWHRMISLIPEVHICMLRSVNICVSLSEALYRVKSPESEDISRAITLITGPSRTADIELTLAIGVHGPKELHVIVLR